MSNKPIFTAYRHSKYVVKVETKDRVICDCISDMETGEFIAAALNARAAIFPEFADRVIKGKDYANCKDL